MGFDNECILNIQSLPGEYFCPVCRTLIYPNEALQSQCTHLFCKPCLAYVVATTHACPYDGYLVTEADSKPLIESNKSLAETIGKVAVHCLYHRSGCQWQGTLSECTAHCTGCSFGNSPVVCNRCGTQIIHSQVQEHAQICPGLQPQAQQVENSQAQASSAPDQAAAQDSSSAALAASASATSTASAPVAASSATTTASAAPAAVNAASAQAQVQGSAVFYPQTATQAATPEQWYQQQQLQYQQYYQQYPGYDPYQQYQQYGQYQQQAHPQYPQSYMQVTPQQVIPGQQQPQPYMQPQAHSLPHPQPSQSQAQVPATVQAQPLMPPQPQQQHLPQSQPQHHPPQHQLNQPAQPPQMPAQQLHAPTQQSHPQAQAQPQTHPPVHGQVSGQQLGQPHPQPHQPRPQLQAPSQHQQPVPPQQHAPAHAQMQHLQPYPQQQPHPQQQPQAHATPHPQPQIQQPLAQIQPHPQSHPQLRPQPVLQSQPQHPPALPVSGYQSYPQPIPGTPQQRPMPMHPQQGMPHQHPQFPPQQPPQMRPPHAQLPMQVQQRPAMPPPQGPPHTNLHPSQQQVQHPVHQPSQQIHQHPVMQPHAQQQGYPPQQPQGHLHPSQPQHIMHPPQSLRPQGPPYMHQHIHEQPHPQLNVSSAQASRPMMVNQGMLQPPVQQSLGGGSKFMQPGVNQHSPNQNFVARSTPRLATPSVHQPGSIQHSPLPNSGSQGALLPASAASQLGATPKQGSSLPDRAGQVTQLEAEQAAKNAEGSEVINSVRVGAEEHQSVESKIRNDGYDSGSIDDEPKATAEVKQKVTQPDDDGRDMVESVEVLGKGPGSLIKDEKEDGSLIKQVTEEGSTNSTDAGTECEPSLKVAGVDKESEGPEGKPDENSGARPSQDGVLSVQSVPGSNKAVQNESLSSKPERASQAFAPQGQIGGTVANNMQVPPQQTPFQHPTHQNTLPHERSFPQAGYHDRNLSQFPRPSLGADVQALPPVPGQERYPLHHISHGHPSSMPDPAMVSQRPPVSERMLPPHMPPPPQMHGQSMAPGQMRPPGHNFPDAFPHPGQTSVAPEPFQRPLMKQPYASYHSEGPTAGASGPGLPLSSARAPAHLGFPQKGFEEQAVGPSSAAVGPPVMGGPSPRVFDAPVGMMARGPPLVPEDRIGRPVPTNAVNSEAYGIKRPGEYGSRQLDPQRPPTEQAPYGHPPIVRTNVMKMNGGMHDLPFGHGLPEDRFRPLPEERFKPFPEEGFKAAQDERFRTFPLDPGRPIVNRRDFEEDLKQFPRPAHLDGDGIPKFDGYMSSSRPLDRGPQQFGLDAASRPHDGGASVLTSRPLPPYQSGAPFSASSGGDALERERSVGLQEHLGRRHDPTISHPDHLRPLPEFGHHRMDSLPLLRSPGREYPGFSSSRFGLGSQSHVEDFDGRDPRFGERFPSDSAGQGARTLPGHFVRGIHEGPESLRMGQLGPLGHSLSSNIRSGETFGGRNFPSLQPSGESFGRMGEPIGFGGYRSHLRIGDPGINGIYPLPGLSNEARHFSSVPFQGDMDAFEHSRKKKPGSMGWCRICKIDCETVEGLDLHSQTREHQKMAMDMVVSIKQDNAKKRKLSSDGVVSFEDANKSRRTSFENRGNRQ